MELMDVEMDLEFPPVLFSKSNRPPPGMKVNYNSKLKNLCRVRGIVGQDVWNYVTNSPLGVIPKFLELNFGWSAKIVHDKLICNQLVCEKHFELWFLIAGQPARFSLFEFEDITGLNCELETGVERNGLPPTGEAETFFQRFPLKAGHTAPSSEEIENLCKTKATEIAGWDRDDKIRLCYLAILSDCLLALDRRSQIPFDYAQMVMCLRTFESFPWGRVCFRELCTEVKSVTSKKLCGGGVRGSYVLKGFVQVLQVFAFVHVPAAGQTLGLPIGEADRAAGLPHLLKFKGVSGLRNIEKPFSDARVICMSTRSDSGINPVWNDSGRDFKVDNLTKYINDGRNVFDIRWTTAENVQMSRNKRKNEEEIGVRGKKIKVTGGKVYSGDDDVNNDKQYQSSGFVPEQRSDLGMVVKELTHTMVVMIQTLKDNLAVTQQAVVKSLEFHNNTAVTIASDLKAITSEAKESNLEMLNCIKSLIKAGNEDTRRDINFVVDHLGLKEKLASHIGDVHIHQDVVRPLQLLF